MRKPKPEIPLARVPKYSNAVTAGRERFAAFKERRRAIWRAEAEMGRKVANISLSDANVCHNLNVDVSGADQGRTGI